MGLDNFRSENFHDEVDEQVEEQATDDVDEAEDIYFKLESDEPVSKFEGQDILEVEQQILETLLQSGSYVGIHSEEIVDKTLFSNDVAAFQLNEGPCLTAMVIGTNGATTMFRSLIYQMETQNYEEMPDSSKLIAPASVFIPQKTPEDVFELAEEHDIEPWKVEITNLEGISYRPFKGLILNMLVLENSSVIIYNDLKRDTKIQQRFNGALENLPQLVEGEEFARIAHENSHIQSVWLDWGEVF